MTSDQYNRFNRKTIRLQNYDYSQPGAYFVTICVQGMKHRLGNVADGEMIMSEIGKIAYDGFGWLEETFDLVEVDVFCIMPNHVHAIISIVEPGRGGVSPPIDASSAKLGRGTLPLPDNYGFVNPINPSSIEKPKINQIIGYYKYSTTVAINNQLNTPSQKFWQRNFYERVVRDDQEYNKFL